MMQFLKFLEFLLAGFSLFILFFLIRSTHIYAHHCKAGKTLMNFLGPNMKQLIELL